MATPLYTRGLAALGRDAPFHKIDLTLDSGQQLEIHHTGEDAAIFLYLHAKSGQQDRTILPIPQECPYMDKCQKCETADGCTHEKQCAYNREMWRSEAQQIQKPYAAHLSDAVAQHLIKFFVEDIKNIQTQLRGLLKSHGDLILKRWKKLSKDKRGRLLSDTAPQILGSWPAAPSECPGDDCYEEHFHQWPGGSWLSIRDLADDAMKLLSILQVRTAHSASSWTIFDVRESFGAWHFNYLPLWYNEQCVTMCGDKYGTLCSFSAEGTHARSAIGFPRAFLTIQIQHQLLYTLQKITKAIVKDSPGTGVTCLESLVASGLRASGGDAAWCSYTHQAYVSPKEFDPKLALSKARAQFEMIQDQLWLMQTDPGYMQAVINSRRLTLRHVVTGMHQKDQVAQLGGLVIDDLITRFHLWYTVIQGCERLQNHVEERESSFLPGEVLSIELSAQFEQVKTLIQSRLLLAKKSFLRVVHREATCENGCCTSHPETSGGTLKVETKHGSDPYTAAGRLQWRLRRFAQCTENLVFSYGYAFDINAMIQDDRIAKVMDRSTYDFLSDMMVLDDINSSLVWSQHVANRDWTHDELGLHWEVSPCSECRLLDDQWVRRIGPLVASFMDASWPKGPQTLAWLEAAIDCRQRLGLLWKTIRDERHRVSKSGCQDLARSSEMFRSAISFDSEPEYLAQVEEEHRLCSLERTKAAAKAEAQLWQEQDYQTAWGAAADDGPVCYKQTKAKAKRIAGALETDLSQLKINEQRRPSQIPELPAVAVKRDSLSVFRKMFTAGNQAEIRWSLFVQAMVDAGFKATESSGSAVNFSSDSGSICFHRPHPDPVIDPIMLHNMARRMHKWFSWEIERFVEREKDS